MIAKTKEEKTVIAYSAQLPSVTPSQRKWAEEHIGEPFAYINKKNAWCSECGKPLSKTNHKEFLVDIIADNEKITCPHCGKKLTVKGNSLGAFHSDKFYYTIITTHKEYQVFRHFVVKKYSQRNCEVSYSINEAVQNWISKTGKETIVARNLSFMSRYCDDWIFSSDMSIKHSNRSYYGYNKYHINAYYTYPVRKYIPSMKKYGFKGKFLDVTPSEFAKNLLGNNEFEYLLKTRQTSIFTFLCRKGGQTIPYKFAVNICNRNNYIVKDASMWYDLLDALSYLGKDLHNPFYICPSNLMEQHDRYVKLRLNKEKEELAKRRREEALKFEAKYKEDKGKFLDLVISNENLVIRPLQSVIEFMEEGTAMHHCVYANGYYKKRDCLILSAKDSNGERIETIEINLKTFQIMQSRGLCNAHTQYHDEILRLVNNNMFMIEAIAESLRATA